MKRMLTRAETEVLRLLAKGYLYREIAAERQVTLDTVKKHCANIYEKLKVRNKIEAINVFAQIMQTKENAAPPHKGVMRGNVHPAELYRHFLPLSVSSP